MFGLLALLTLPGLAVTDESGVMLQLRDVVRDKAALIHAVDPADPLTASFLRAVERRVADHPDILLLSVSPRPDREWIDAWRATDRWRLLTAAADALPSGALLLIDREGKVAARVASAQGPDAVAAELRRLAAPSGARLHEIAGCAGCHRTPLSGLATPAFRRAGRAVAYDAASFCVALREGRDPAGAELSSAMPRYGFAESECRALWLRVVELSEPNAPRTPSNTR